MADGIHLDSREGGILKIRWDDEETNEAYRKLVKEVLAGTVSVIKINEFINEHALHIMKTEDNNG